MKKILIAFILNLSFSLFELIGGVVTGSVAILSDALHDLGDAMSIGISCLFEKKSRKAPDGVYTYGYSSYSVLGGLFTTLVLLLGSLAVIFGAIKKIFSPSDINYDGMILFAVVGAGVNFLAALFTKDGESINQRAVNLHMLEDVLGWLVVLVGAIVMRFTNFSLIDPLMSIGVALFILIHALKALKEIFSVFLGKVPEGIDVEKIKKHITEIEGVLDIHHLHIWTPDAERILLTAHVVVKGDRKEIKEKVRNELFLHGITHVTLELEDESEECHDKACHAECHHHHHHHH